MRVKTIELHNYKSIKHLVLDCGKVMVLLGPNNHGKSNVLAGLDFFFSASAKPRSGDFFYHRESGEDVLWIELTFANLSPQETRTFKKYVSADGAVRIRKTAALKDGQVTISYNGWKAEPTEEWLKDDYAGSIKKKEDLHPQLAPHLPDGQRFSKTAVQAAQDSFIAANQGILQYSYVLEDGPLLGLKNVAAGTLPDAFIIPAVRDLTDETKTKNTTLFGRLLNRALGEMALADEAFGQIKRDLIALVKRLNRENDQEDSRPRQLRDLENVVERELRDWQVKLDIKIAPPEIEKVFELGTSLHVFDGVTTPAEEKGHGLQRALIFALTRAWATSLRSGLHEGETTPRAASDSVVLLVEEPELYLHPHAQRRLARNLRDIGNAEHHQVFICTHSPQFVDMDTYRDIAVLYKDSAAEGTRARQYREDIFQGEDQSARKRRFNLGHWVNPDRAELFFARRVIFVEGATEKVLLPYLAERMGIFDPEVSVIDCGSKFNLPLYIRLAGAFKLDFVVIHDEDPVDSMLAGDRLQKAQKTFSLNKDIIDLATHNGGQAEMLSPDFEQCSGVSKSQGDKKGKPLAALDHFENLAPEKFPERLRALVEAVYSGTRTAR